MKYIIIYILFIVSCKLAISQVATPFSGYILNSADSTHILFANIKIENLKGDSLVYITSGDDGRIYVPNLPEEFVMKITHPKYVMLIDTIRISSIRNKSIFYMNPK